MTRSRIAIVLAACLALASTEALRADVRSDQKTKFQLAGALGKVVNFFGGKAAREGVTSTVAIKGNRMMTSNGDGSAQIVDLSEEKIYDIDIKKKSYRVTTFADLRRQMEEARKRAQEEAKKEQASEKAEPTKQAPNAKQDPNEPQLDVRIGNSSDACPLAAVGQWHDDEWHRDAASVPGRGAKSRSPKRHMSMGSPRLDALTG